MNTEMLNTIEVTCDEGIYRVPAEFENGFHLVPCPSGNLKLAFWDEKRLHDYLRTFGFHPLIQDTKN